MTPGTQFSNYGDWGASANVAGAAITSQKGKDAKWTYTAQGVLTLTLGNDGIDADHCGIRLDYDGPATLSCTVVHTSATVKTFNFVIAAAAAPTDPTRVSVDVYRRNTWG